MILKNVAIKNFKGIEECILDLQPGINLLIGDNGFGKTSILEALSVCLGGFIAGIEDVSTKHFQKDEIRVVLEHTGDGSFNKRYITPVSISCEAVIENETFCWSRNKNSLRASRSTVEPRDICRKAYQMANEENHILPVLSYQSTARMWMQKREASENIFEKPFYRTVGYEGCLAEASNIKMLMNWIRRMDRLEWKNKKQVGEYQAVKNILCDFMNAMGGEKVSSAEYDVQSDELVFVTNKTTLPIRNLSSGYQSLIWMILDIAIRMAILNPDMLSEINLAPGIILIDELDMHLHPKWQWNITKALKSTFPNVQFIAATHSPIVIASCKKDHLIMLGEKGEISYAETPYGLDINDTLSAFQNSDSMVRDVSLLFQQFHDSLDREKYHEAEELLNVIKNTVGENHPKVTSAEMELEMEQVLLEE